MSEQEKLEFAYKWLKAVVDAATQGDDEAYVAVRVLNRLKPSKDVGVDALHPVQP